MGCCLSTPVVKEETPLIVDLSEVLCDRAWKSFYSTFNPCQKLMLKREHFTFEVPENYFDFQEIKQDPLDNLAIEVPAGHTLQARSTTRGKLDRSTGQIPSRSELTNPESVTLDTEFSNETAETQKYTFRFEKTRRSEIEVTFQKGFTFGGKANFSVKIPVIEVGVDAEMQYQVTKSEGQRFEESLVMEATSEIAVGPNSRYTANVQLEEKALHASFMITSRMSMPEGRAPVYIKRKSDGKKVFVYTVNNLIDVFNGVVPCAKIVQENNANLWDKIDFEIKGIVKGTLACNHKIMLTSNEPEEAKKDAKNKYMKDIADRSHED